MPQIASQATSAEVGRQTVLSAPDTTRFEQLIEQLLALIPPEAPHALLAQPGSVDEVLFSLEDGPRRYLLVRRTALTHPPMPLSPREVAIARLVARGLPNKCIGDTLDISPWTVATHLRRIFSKLHVASRAAMVARLTERHLI